MRNLGLAPWLLVVSGEDASPAGEGFDLEAWASAHGIEPSQLSECASRASSMARLDDAWTVSRVTLHGDAHSVWAIGLALGLRVEELCEHADAGTLPPGPPVAPERALADVRPLVEAVAGLAKRLGLEGPGPGERAAWALSAIDRRANGLVARAPAPAAAPPPAARRPPSTARLGPVLGVGVVLAAVVVGAVLMPQLPPPPPPSPAELASVMPNLTDYRMEGTTLILVVDPLWPKRPAALKAAEVERIQEHTGSLDWWNLEIRSSTNTLWMRLDDEAEDPISWYGAAAENMELASR